MQVFQFEQCHDQDAGADGLPARPMLAGRRLPPNEGSSPRRSGPNHAANEYLSGAATPKEEPMADIRQPTFVTALTAVFAGAAVSAWISAAFVGVYPASSIEAWAILTSVLGAVFVKLVLRALKFDIALPFAAGALMAGRLAGLTLVQVMPDLGGHALPAFPTFGLFSTFPSLVLAAWLVQISAGRVRAIVY
jgi:hypothetical protein